MGRNYHDVGRGKKAIQHGQRQAIGPMLNTRHPRKFKLEPLAEKSAPIYPGEKRQKAEIIKNSHGI